MVDKFNKDLTVQTWTISIPIKRKRTCPEIFNLKPNKGGPTTLDFLMMHQIDARTMY